MKKVDISKAPGSLLAKIKHLLGYNSNENVPIETLLENTAHYYENIIECLPGNVYWMDAKGITVGCNQNVLDMLQLSSSEQFKGLSFEQMGAIGHWTDATTQSFKMDTLEVIQTGLPKLNIEEPPIQNKEGSLIYFLTHRVPLFDQKKNIIGVVGISIDITQRKQMELALQNEKIKAEAANSAKTEFISNMSHDIRTPLSGVVGMSQMIEDNAVDPTQKQYAHWLHDSGDQLLHMLNGILDVVSADNVNENDLHVEPFDFRRMIQNLIRAC